MGLLAKVKGAPPPKRGPLSWFERLAPEVQAELRDLRQSYLVGELPGWTVNSLLGMVMDEFESRGVEPPSRSTWERWWKQEDRRERNGTG